MSGYFSFQWHLTNACDQRCRHCYIYSDDNADAGSSCSRDQMKHITAAIRSFGKQFDRLPYLYLTGGDPLLFPHFWELAEYLHADDIPYSVLGNPFHLTPEVCRHLRETGCEKYQMSLDGLERTHDWMRRPGSFRETLQRLPLLRDAGITTVIMATVSSVNIGEILPLMELLSGHHVDVFAFARFCSRDPEGNGIAPAAYRQLLDDTRHLARRLTERGAPMRLADKDHLWTLYAYEEGYFQIPEEAQTGLIYDGCSCGSAHLTILPDGTVYACRRTESPVGNALHESLADIWLGTRMEAYREFQNFRKCSKCELLSWCRGCPAVASAAGGDFYAPDPQCWKEITE